MSQNTDSLAEWLIKLGLQKQLNHNDILAGITVHSALKKVVPSYNGQLNTSNTAINRVNNWSALIIELQKIGIKVTQSQKSKILQGDDKIVYNILGDIKVYQSKQDKNRQEIEVDINNIDSRGDPKSSKSLLQLFILVLIKCYGFSVKESVALLSNNSKYLAHILAKGFKDSYKPVENMLVQFTKLLPNIIVFCRNKQNETFFLKSLKPGLISKFQNISLITLQLLTDFVKSLPDKYEIVKIEIIPTLILSFRRHESQIKPIIKSLIELIGFNKNLLTFFISNSTHIQTSKLFLELLAYSESENCVSEVFEQFKIQQFLNNCIENIKSSQWYIISLTTILKIAEVNFTFLNSNGDSLNRIVQYINTLNLSKRTDLMIFINQMFSLLHILGKRKNSLAPLLFKLAVEKYKGTINQDESHNYLFNFLETIQKFPSIPSQLIVEAIIHRYENSTTYLGQLEFSIIEISIQENIDEKLALKVYNIITKIFVEEIGYCDFITTIIGTILKRFEDSIFFDLTVKFIKICLAVHHANLRKLNYSKSLIEGTIKIDKTNVFFKAKNKQIQSFLTSILGTRNQKLTKTLEPLICYSFIQSELKNKEQAEGLRSIVNILGDETELRKIYEADAKLMLEDVRNQNRKKNDSKQKTDNSRYKEFDIKNRISSDASLLIKKKDYVFNLSNFTKVSSDAQKGLEKYTKAYMQKVVKQSLEEEKKVQEQIHKQQLRKRFALKILQKGINIGKQISLSNLYEFGSKQRQMIRDMANDFNYLPFYNPNFEEERDIKSILHLLKKYSKILKVYYNLYGGRLRPVTLKLFEDISDRNHLMQSSNVWKLLRDHGLDQFITVKQVHFLVQKINANLKKQYKDSSLLDYEVFEEFIIQASLVMFSRPPKDMRSKPIAHMIQETIDKFKQLASINKVEKIFDDIEFYEVNKNEQINILNQKLSQNPDYTLPEGYKKIIHKDMVFQHQIFLESMQQQYKAVHQVLDQIFYEKLGFHIIEPYSKVKIQTLARPILYQNVGNEQGKDRAMTSLKKSQIKLSAIGKEFKQSDGNDGENNHDLAKLVQNKYLKDKKQKEEQRLKRQEEEQKRRQQRDRQLKALLQKHRQKQQEIEKQKDQRKLDESKREQQNRKKKQKYEYDLKKKVEQFMQKKRQQKIKQDEQTRRKKEEQIRNMERMKQDIERKKRMVDQAKQKKKQEQEARLEKEKEEKKRKDEEHKKRIEEKKLKNKKLLQEYKERKGSKQESPNQKQIVSSENEIKDGSQQKN